MIVIRYALSDPQKSELRLRLQAAHKAHIHNAPFQVLMSGPAFEEGSQVTNAALLVAEVETFTQLVTFSAADPFVHSGVYSRTWLLEWRPSLGKIQDLFT